MYIKYNPDYMHKRWSNIFRQFFDNRIKSFIIITTLWNQLLWKQLHNYNLKIKFDEHKPINTIPSTYLVNEKVRLCGAHFQNRIRNTRHPLCTPRSEWVRWQPPCTCNISLLNHTVTQSADYPSMQIIEMAVKWSK